MKSLFTAASMAALMAATIPMAGCASSYADGLASADDDRVETRHETRMVLANGSRMFGHHGGPVVEIRGDKGERTLHIVGEGEDSRITINGQLIEIRDGAVFIDGQRHEAGEHAMVILDGDRVEIVEGGEWTGAHGDFAFFSDDFDFEFDGGDWDVFAEEMAARGEEMGRHFAFRFETEGMGEDIAATIEQALAGLELEWSSAEWDDLSAEERAEIREELDEAREELREALREMNVELREVHREAREAAAEARREVRMRVIERDTARSEARAEAREHAERRHVEIMRHHGGGHGGENRDIRIEENAEGERRVWIDGEEQTGDDLTEWLNRVESESLAGGNGERRVMRFAGRGDIDVERNVFVHRGRGDGERVVIELDGENVFTSDGEAVSEWIEDQGEGNVRVLRIGPGDNGERRIVIEIVEETEEN